MPSFNNQLHWQGIVATTALILVALAFAGFGYAEWSSKAAFDQFLNTDTPSEFARHHIGEHSTRMQSAKGSC